MSKLNSIVSNIITTIQGINGSPTYTNTIANAFNDNSNQVEQGDRALGEIPEDQFPHFGVVPVSETRTKEPNFLRNEAICEIVCKFRDESQSNAMDWVADVEIALAQDVRRGITTYVHDSWISQITWDSQVFRDGGVNQTFRVVKLEFHIVYTFPFGSP